MTSAALPFHKMEGCRNEFVVVRESHLDQALDPDGARQLCDRQAGIGADGVLVIGTVARVGSEITVAVRVWNADGTQAETCGNGLRCVALRLLDDGDWNGRDGLVLATLAGPSPVTLDEIQDGFACAVELGCPELSGSVEVIETGQLAVSGWRVSMGNPHFVVFDEAQDEPLPDLASWAAPLAECAAFPEGTNVEWIQVTAPNQLTGRVWERGVGETAACGSGACAAAAAARRTGLCNDDSIEVILPGGSLQVSWDGRDKSPVTLSGPARTVYRDTWTENP